MSCNNTSDGCVSLDAGHELSFCEKLLSEVLLLTKKSSKTGCSSIKVRGLKVPANTGNIVLDYNSAPKPTTPNEFQQCDLIVLEYNGGVYIYTGVDKETATSADDFIYLNPASQYEFEAVAKLNRVTITETNSLIADYDIPAANRTKAGVLLPEHYTKIVDPWAIIDNTLTDVPSGLFGRFIGDIWVGVSGTTYIWVGNSWRLISGGNGGGSGLAEVNSATFGSVNAVGLTADGSEVYRINIPAEFGNKPLLYTIYDSANVAIIPDAFEVGLFENTVPDPQNPLNVVRVDYCLVTLFPRLTPNEVYTLVYAATTMGVNGGNGGSSTVYTTPSSEQIITINNTTTPKTIYTNLTAFNSQVKAPENMLHSISAILAGTNVTISAPVWNVGLNKWEITIAATGGGGSVTIQQNLADPLSTAVLSSAAVFQLFASEATNGVKADTGIDGQLFFQAGGQIDNIEYLFTALSGINFIDEVDDRIFLIHNTAGLHELTFGMPISLRTGAKTNSRFLIYSSNVNPFLLDFTKATSRGKERGRLLSYTNTTTGDAAMLDITNTKHFFWSAVGQLIANEPINLLASQQIRESYLDPATGTYQIVAGSFGDNTTTLFTSMAVSVPSGQVVRNPLGQVVLNLQFLASGITENLTSFITLPYSPVSIIPFIATAIVANTPYVLEGQIQTNGSLHLKSITGAIVVSSKVIINLTYDTAVRY